MCSEKGYAHTEQGKEERRKKGYTGLCSLMETSILLIQFLNFYLCLFICFCLLCICMWIAYSSSGTDLCGCVCTYVYTRGQPHSSAFPGYSPPFFFSVVCNLPSRLGWLASSPWIYLHSTGISSLYHHV